MVLSLYVGVYTIYPYEMPTVTVSISDHMPQLKRFYYCFVEIVKIFLVSTSSLVFHDSNEIIVFHLRSASKGTIFAKSTLTELYANSVLARGSTQLP